ncbi:cell division control protein 1-like isoform X2 [Hevea brasiliensis]|uniref:cell division control protein 1-like isoform X2 n=1 Tax=Hevea brasiliensis TaxID=3981 RepID=UPI0025F500BD|nr:cell division control protein 1-like isoform X2 [Hevea brasiliensis]
MLKLSMEHIFILSSPRHPQENLASVTWEFVKNVSTDIQLVPRVLLTDIPLYRRHDTLCGPHRSSPIINQALIVSGHDHDQCTVVHDSKFGPVTEPTLGTISWQRGNLYPSFMLLSVSNSANANVSTPEDPLISQPCFLPQQTHIYIWGNAVIRPTARKNISQEMEVSMNFDINVEVGNDPNIKLPHRTSKSKTSIIIQRLMRTFRKVTVIAAVNVPIYMMLLFKDWIDQ